jgi:transposase
MVRGRLLKLTDAQVDRVLTALAAGVTIASLAKRFGVSTTTIRGAARGRGAYGGAVARPLDRE